MRPARGADLMTRRTVPTVLVLAALALAPLLAGAQDPVSAGSWYTAEQAERGRQSYLAHCAECHARDLNARAIYIELYGYPALRGTWFLDRWQGESVHTLYQLIRHTMPLDAPGTLAGETYADIVAFILQGNGFPAGDMELPPGNLDQERLRGMFIEPAALAAPAAPQEVRAVTLREAGAPRGIAAAPTEQQADGLPELDPPASEQVRGGAWYTAEQAVRAEDQYSLHCSRCHGRALQGVGVAPSLAGGNFIERWEGKTVGDLFVVVSALMPADGPGELEPEVYADVVAYLLWRNGFPLGDAELPLDVAALQEMVITPDLAEVPEVP